MLKMSLQSPAKINTFLEVTHKRDDGFHEIDTIIHAINLFDDISVTVAKMNVGESKISIKCSFENLDSEAFPCDERNIAVKAAYEFLSESGINAEVQIDLHKRIPWGAGLGGGSSNAASVIIALNELLSLYYDEYKLAEIGAKIGSDVPFFFFQPAARCQGRGEIVTPINIKSKIQLVILFPNIFCSTAEIYHNIKLPLKKNENSVIIIDDVATICQIKIDKLAPLFFNRLEKTALEQSAKLQKIYDLTNNFSHLYLKKQLSGSGSAIIFYVDKLNNENLANNLRKLNLGKVFEAETLL